jgi:hypothetical protein
MRNRKIEAPRPDEVRSLAQLLAQLAEINQRLARSTVMLQKIERPGGGPGASANERNPEAAKKT